MTDRMAVEKRHRDFTNAEFGTGKAFYAAAVNVLGESGWKFTPDSAKAMYGWWVLEGSEYARPMGDSKDFYKGALNTVKLYTNVELDTVQAIAAEFRRDAARRVYNI